MTNQTQTKLSQKLNSMNLNTQCSIATPQKNIYQVPTTLGKLTIQITRFTHYIMIILTYSGALKLDGYLQIAYPTQFNDKPSVINIQKDQGQMDNEKLSQILSKQLNCPVFLSFNLEELIKGSQQELLSVLRKILFHKEQQKE